MSKQEHSLSNLRHDFRGARTYLPALLLLLLFTAPTVFGQGASATAPSTSVAKKIPRPTDLIIVDVSPLGFYPKTLTFPAGKYRVRLRNRARSTALTISVLDAASVLQRAVSFSGVFADWEDLVQFLPGLYSISVAEHPSWRCTLHVQ